MSDFKDQEQASYSADPATVDLSVIIETYKALLTGDSLPERVAVQTVVLQTLLDAAAATAYERENSKGMEDSKNYWKKCAHKAEAENDELKDKLARIEKPKPIGYVSSFAIIALFYKPDTSSVSVSAEIDDEHSIAIYTAPFDVAAVRGAAFSQGLEAAAGYHNNEAEYYEARHGSKDGVPFPIVAGWHRLDAQRIRALSPVEQVEQSRVAQLEAALTSILFEDSDKSEQQRMIDRVKARAVLEQAEPVDQWQDITTIGEREHGRLIIVGTRDGKGRWCATIRRTTRVIEERNSSITGALKNTMRLKWEPTHFIELTALNSVAGR